jgi:hypothetical protein
LSEFNVLAGVYTAADEPRSGCIELLSLAFPVVIVELTAVEPGVELDYNA